MALRKSSLAELVATVVPSTVIDDVYIDLDGVTADFEKARDALGHTSEQFKLTMGSYLWLELVEGALDSINYLRRLFPDRVWFLTKPPKYSPYAYVEKALWVQRYFGNDGLHSLIVAQNKSLVGTSRSILVDDRPHKGGVDRFRGTVVFFGGDVNTESPRSSLIPAKDWPGTLDVIHDLIKRRSG